MTLYLFGRRTDRRHATPQVQPATVSVNVMATVREASVDAIPYTPEPELAALIRDGLPNQPISENLRAARYAAVLDTQAAFLADRTGTVEPPERWEVVDACRFGAEHIRDGIVIA